jgi:hypothetical protein
VAVGFGNLSLRLRRAPEIPLPVVGLKAHARSLLKRLSQTQKAAKHSFAQVSYSPKVLVCSLMNHFIRVSVCFERDSASRVPGQPEKPALPRTRFRDEAP